MKTENLKILNKLQSIYNILIVKDDSDERIFIINSYVPYTPQTPQLLITGKDVTILIQHSSLASSLSDLDFNININEKQLLETKIEEIPVYNYRFSSHYRYELMESR